MDYFVFISLYGKKLKADAIQFEWRHKMEKAYVQKQYLKHVVMMVFVKEKLKLEFVKI